MGKGGVSANKQLINSAIPCGLSGLKKEAEEEVFL